MKAYIFQAALLCEPCAKPIQEARSHALSIEAVKAGRSFSVDDESTYDSDDCPKGPYSDGGGEADCPQHCDHCGVFLENPLTSDGVEYVREKFNFREDTSKFDCPLDWHEFAERARANGEPVLADWAEYYYSYFD